MQTNIEIQELPPLNEYSGAEIFVIDDEQLVVDTLSYFLRSAGFKKVHGFTDSSAAIATMQFIRPDVLFTDIKMPGLDGNIVAKMVRSYPHMYTVPIIAITGYPSIEASRSIIEAGAESVLPKPVSKEILVQRTVQAIEEATGDDYELMFE